MKIKPYLPISRLAGEVEPKNSEYPTMNKQLRAKWAQDLFVLLENHSQTLERLTLNPRILKGTIISEVEKAI